MQPRAAQTNGMSWKSIVLLPGDCWFKHISASWVLTNNSQAVLVWALFDVTAYGDTTGQGQWESAIHSLRQRPRLQCQESVRLCSPGAPYFLDGRHHTGCNQHIGPQVFSVLASVPKLKWIEWGALENRIHVSERLFSPPNNPQIVEKLEQREFFIPVSTKLLAKIAYIYAGIYICMCEFLCTCVNVHIQMSKRS